MENQAHWVNNFWGNEDAGYKRLMERVHQAKHTCDELKQFYRERLSIEQEYAKKLNALSRRALGSNETGGMKQSLEAVRSTTKNAAATHETVARQLGEQLLAPLDAFTASMRSRSKTIEDTMGQLTKAKASQNSNSEKARSRYAAECNKISGYQAQQNLLMGRELDKNNQKLDRSTYQVEGLQRQYQDSLKALAQVMENWNAEWRLSCDKLEQIEEERLTFTKSNLWAYANSLSTACVADDEGCEAIRLTLERCEPVKDVENYSREFGTGSKIQDPPEFVNFLQGFSRDNDSEDGHYHVANFNSSLNGTEVPDLGISSPPTSSVQSSPGTGGFDFTPMSSPGTANVPFDDHQDSAAYQSDTYHQQKAVNQQQMAQVYTQPAAPAAPATTVSEAPVKDVKKRRSWAMPFKRKSNVDSNLKYVSALDQPTPMFEPTQSYAPAPTQAAAPARAPAADGRRQSWAPTTTAQQSSYTSAAAIDPSSPNSGGQDPLLTALERLKTPNLKQRPKSMGYTATSMPNGPPSPYGNGARTEIAAPSSGTTPGSPQQKETRRKPVHRKQVGSDASSKLPTMTSDGRRIIKHSRAQYDYRAAIPEEVTFRKGDLLLITEMQEDGWWDSEVAGRGVFGLAPSNFLADAY